MGRIELAKRAGSTFDDVFDAAVEGGAEEVKELEPDEEGGESSIEVRPRFGFSFSLHRPY